MTDTHVILWPPNWHRIFQRGPVGRERIADWFLDKIAAMGLTSCAVGHATGWTDWDWIAEYVIWASRKIRRAGLKVVLATNASLHSSPALFVGPKEDIEVFHTGAFGKPFHNFRFAYCPSYRGQRYRAMICYLRRFTQLAEPDVVISDDEVWPSAKWQEQQAGYDIVTACSRCRSHGRYRQAVLEIAHDYTEAVRESCPGVPVWFFGTDSWWTPGVGSGPAPALYRPDGVETFRRWLVEGRRPGIYYDWPVDGVIGGYPWLNLYAGNEREAKKFTDGVYEKPEVFREYCAALRAAGAKGVIIYPGLEGVWTRTDGTLGWGGGPYGQQWEDSRAELIKAAVDVFEK